MVLCDSSLCFALILRDTSGSKCPNTMFLLQCSSCLLTEFCNWYCRTSNVIFQFLNTIFYARVGKFASGGACFTHLSWFRIVLCDSASVHGQVSIQMGCCLEVLWKKFWIIGKIFSIYVLPDFGEIRLQGQLIYFSLMTHLLSQDFIGTLNRVVSSTSECHAIFSSLSQFCPKLCLKALKE